MGSLLHGISVIISQLHDQTWKIVDCASRFLTPTERNYYPVELEMLAVTWGCQRMSKYLHGLPHFLLETDHKPLIPILNYRPIVEMSPRIQRLRMKLLKFQFTAEHVPGKEIIDADAFLRAPVAMPTAEDEIAEKELNVYVNAVIKNLPASDQRIEEIKQRTLEDQTLRKLKLLLPKWPITKAKCPEEIKPYWNIRSEITTIAH